MVNYKNGKIFKLVSNKTDKIYIGSTTQALSKRIADYRAKYRYQNDPDMKLIAKQQNAELSPAISELIQHDDCKIVLIENVKCNRKDELLARQQFYLDQNENKTNKINAFQTPEQYKLYQQEYRKHKV